MLAKLYLLPDDVRMPKRQVDTFEVLDEYAFICDKVDREFVSLRVAPIQDTANGDDFRETHALNHFDPDYSSPFTKGSAGMLHIYGVRYVGGGEDIIMTNTVFPDGRYNTSLNASSIAHTELMIRNGDLTVR